MGHLVDSRALPEHNCPAFRWPVHIASLVPCHPFRPCHLNFHHPSPRFRWPIHMIPSQSCMPYPPTTMTTNCCIAPTTLQVASPKHRPPHLNHPLPRKQRAMQYNAATPRVPITHDRVLSSTLKADYDPNCGLSHLPRARAVAQRQSLPSFLQRTLPFNRLGAMGRRPIRPARRARYR